MNYFTFNYAVDYLIICDAKPDLFQYKFTHENCRVWFMLSGVCLSICSFGITFPPLNKMAV